MRTLSRGLAWVLCAVLLLGLFSANAAEDAPGFRFDDVADEGAYYFAPVYWAYGHDPQITVGVNDQSFMPDAPCTRAQVVTFLWRAESKPATEQAENPFSDVEEAAYYYDAVLWAVENGVTTGVSADLFRPEQTCTRGQIVTFLWRNAGQPEPSAVETAFTDVDEGACYAKAVAWALENGITTGASETSFRPEQICTRGQIVTFLYRASQLRDDPVPVHVHAYQKEIVAPTCTEGGYTVYTCACGDSYEADRTEALGHDYASVVAAPTCTQKGSTTFTCSRCGDSYVGDEKDALGHDYKAEVTAPTCTEGGYTVYTCVRCGDSHAGDETDALGHDWGEGVVTKQPTETETGVRTYTCVRCGEKRTEPIPTLTHVHVYQAVATVPTCTEKGFTTYTCDCGDSYTGSETPALGHDYDSVVTPPTCTEQGCTTHICKRCGDSFIDHETAPLGHSFGEWIESTAATCTAEGEQTRVCSRCGEKETRKLEALGHDYKAVATAPACTESGFTTYTCSRCDHSYRSDETAALGHEFENGVCIRCGATDPDFEPVVVEPAGYLSAVPFGEGFIACGTGGRIDFISVQGEIRHLESGTKADLRSVYADYPNILVSGENGTVLISTDAGESFTPMGLSADLDLNGAVEYRGMLFCAGSGGSIYRLDSNGWKKARIPTNNDIISLIITRKYLVAISAETDVLLSENGTKWEHMNFNEEYEGLYPPYVFTRAVGAGETFFVLGYDEQTPNLPLIMYTDTGEVWMQKPISIINGEYITGEENLSIHDICFNTDQIVGMLDDGRILAITDCFKCNEEMQLDQHYDLWATAIREEGVLVCGEDFFSRVLSRRQIRQDKIGEEQAWYDVQRGALLIDVRTASERAGGYIKGSIHVPLAELAERLPEITDDPYQEIIFYCASGGRAQRATEQAVEMGYETVYNLGGLSNLTDGYFEIVKD